MITLFQFAGGLRPLDRTASPRDPHWAGGCCQILAVAHGGVGTLCSLFLKRIKRIVNLGEPFTRNHGSFPLL